MENSARMSNRGSSFRYQLHWSVVAKCGEQLFGSWEMWPRSSTWQLQPVGGGYPQIQQRNRAKGGGRLGNGVSCNHAAKALLWRRHDYGSVAPIAWSTDN
jgi:hypothetical protein